MYFCVFQRAPITILPLLPLPPSSPSPSPPSLQIQSQRDITHRFCFLTSLFYLCSHTQPPLEMPQCPHCEFFFTNEADFDGHLTVFHPHTIEAAEASKRLIQRAKERKKTRRVDHSMKQPPTSPTRNMQATIHAERFDPIPPKRLEMGYHASRSPTHVMENRRDAIVNRDLTQRDDQIRLQQLQFEAETRARLEREYHLKRRDDLHRHALDVNEAMMKKRADLMEVQLTKNRERRKEDEARITHKIQEELEPTIRGLFNKGMQGQRATSPHRERLPAKQHGDRMDHLAPKRATEAPLRHPPSLPMTPEKYSPGSPQSTLATPEKGGGSVIFSDYTGPPPPSLEHRMPQTPPHARPVHPSHPAHPGYAGEMGGGGGGGGMQMASSIHELRNLHPIAGITPMAPDPSTITPMTNLGERRLAVI